LAEQYNASAIQVLEGLEPVRKRPGMYIGSTGHRGLHHLVYEVVDNSVDEALAGYCTTIDVTILPDASVRVVANGRGIPVDTMASQDNKSALEIVMTKLHAGGKFGGEGYKVSGGLHGVGISVVNALSDKLTVEVCRDGWRYRQAYQRGIPTADVAKVDQCGDRKGTTIHFKPDSQIFDDLNFNFSTLSQRLREMAFLNRSLRISLTDEREETDEVSALGVEDEAEEGRGEAADEEAAAAKKAAPAADMSATAKALAEDATVEIQFLGKGPGGPKTVVYCYEGGIVDFVKHINKHKEPSHSKIIRFEGDDALVGEGDTQ
jgi:DNA gyrase subunit B